MLLDMKVGVRLALGFAALLACMLAMAGIAVWRLYDANAVTHTIVHQDALAERIVSEWRAETNVNLSRVLIAVQIDDPALQKLLASQIEATTRRISELQKSADALVTDEQSKVLLAEVGARRKAYIEARQAVQRARVEGKAAGSAEVRQLIGDKLNPAIAAYARSQGQFADHFALRSQVSAALAERKFRSAVLWQLVLAGLATVIGGLACWRLTRSVTVPLAQAVGVAEAMARGDIGGEIAATGKDEMAQLLRAMQAMVGSFRDFAGAQQEMARQHEAGATGARIPADRFSGVYGRMAQSVNELAASHIAVTMQVVDVVQHYAIGDLSVDMQRLPGDMARITEAVDGVKASLQSINGELATLVDAAARGDFRVRGEVDRYQHDFRRMVETLNRLMEVSDRGLSQVVRVLGALAKGDLTEKIVNDFGGAFGQLRENSNATIDQLTVIVGRLREATESINAMSREIATGNSDLSTRTEDQAASLGQTAASMAQLTGTVTKNAESARQATALAVGASDIAVRGGRMVGEVVTTMSSISESSRKIHDIIGVIDDIAFQTNILALNAAVEAARAGEQGRGFAVVATEVRNLAQRSAGAAKEIKSLIGDSVDKVGAGTRLVNAAGDTMAKIVDSIQRVSGIVAEISAASQEQGAGIAQVSQAITRMDGVTRQNAALVEQSAAASRSLAEQALVLARAVGVFRMVGAPAADAGGPRDAAPLPGNVSRLPAAAGQRGGRQRPAVGPGDWSDFWAKYGERDESKAQAPGDRRGGRQPAGVALDRRRR